MKTLLFHKHSYKWWVLFTVSLGALNVSLDSSILIVCYPTFVEVFHTNSSVIGWINIANLIMSQGIGITIANIGDMIGLKMVYMLGLGFYGIGMLACTFSQNPIQLILGRALQGVGAAAGWSLTTAIVVAVFPTMERGRALGILTGVYSVGLVAGPIIGGLILDMLDWRGVFYTRIPLVLSALGMGWAIIKEQRGKLNFKFDTLGSLTLLVCLSSFMFFLSFGTKLGFTSPSIVFMGVMTIALFILFIFIESQALQPIIDLTLFKMSIFSSTVVSGGLHNAASATAIFTTPFYLSGALGRSSPCENS